jgi:16S rRNA processing protein RimM
VAGDSLALPADAIEVGRVLDAWGVKGWIKVEAYSADPQALFSCRQWHLARGRPPRSVGLLRIAEAREHGDHVVARAHDVEDREAAESLRGASVFVPRSSFPTPQADEYYWVDLIGSSVVNREGDRLGVVRGLLETGPTCVLRIEPAATELGAHAQADAETNGPAEILIPFVAAYVDEVRPDERRIMVDWQRGD